MRGCAEDRSGFLICTYWLVERLALAGQDERARLWFSVATGYTNDLGLLADEADGATGEPLGNLPQAFSHIGLINAAWRIAHPARSTPASTRTSTDGVPDDDRTSTDEPLPTDEALPGGLP